MVLPPQFLDLEAVHMPAFTSDSSGESFSGSDIDSHPSFIDDDTPIELTAADVVFVDAFVAPAMPITASKLREQPTSPTTVRKRRRIIETPSSSP